MTCFRQRRVRLHIALIAMFGLLWSQCLLAGHIACALTDLATGAVHSQAQARNGAAVDHCRPAPAVADDPALCDAHCSRSDLHGEIGRTIPVFVLPAVPALSMVALRALAGHAELARAQAPVNCWHRPTPNPASVLLI